MNRDPRFALSMDESAQRETPHIGIFWVVQTPDGEARLLSAGCPLDQAEPYGDCLTYGPGHYETWAQWRRDRSVDPALRALVRSYEYEDWPRGRIIFDRARDLFVLYADRKLLTPATIARIATQFHLPKERTEVQSDWHYQSTEMPYGLAIEIKFAESMSEPIPAWKPRYDELSDASGLFLDPAATSLRSNPLQQLWREQMLAQSMLDNNLYDQGYFVLIAPAPNYHVQDAAEAYQTHLREPVTGKVRFVNLTLEEVIAVLRLSDHEHADALHNRYCDFWKVEAELERNAPQFGLVTKRKRKLREGTALNLDERNADAQDFITVTGADFCEGQGEPYYAAGRDFISMPTFEAFKDADCFYATSFHELGHWSGHKSRLDRDLTSRFGNRAYAAEELVAELASAFLCAEFGKHGECR